MGILTNVNAELLADDAAKAYAAGAPVWCCQMTEKLSAIQVANSVPNWSANIAKIEAQGWWLDKFSVSDRKDQPVAYCVFRRRQPQG